MNLNGKKLFLIGFIVVLLVGIPLTVYLLQQQTHTQQHAAASTNLAFSPDSSATSPISKNVNDTIPLDVTVDPGKNLVSFVKLEIQYDPTYLSVDKTTGFKANTNAFPSVLEGPIFSPGKIAVTLSVGPNPTNAIQSKVTAATITFTALKDTPAGTPTLVSYTSNSQVLSIASSDQASENVLSSATPATITIGGSSTIPSGTPTPTGSVSVSPTATIPSPTPTSAISEIPTEIPTPTVADTPTPISSVSGIPSSNQAPVCSSLTADRATTGTAPFSLTFTANGSDSDGTISKVTFNYGDGQTNDIQQSGGIGTASVNVQSSHTYNNPGTYTATAVLTDNAGAVSTGTTTAQSGSSTSCTQTVTVNAASGGTTSVTTNPTPTMPATGSTGLSIGIGLGAALLILGGGLLFFIL